MEIYFQNKDNCLIVIRWFTAKVRETGFIVDTPRYKRIPTKGTHDNIATGARREQKNSSTSTSKQLYISHAS